MAGLGPRRPAESAQARHQAAGTGYNRSTSRFVPPLPGRPTRRARAVVLAVALGALLGAPGAGAAARSVPFGFLGVGIEGSIFATAQPDAEFGQMVQDGVEGVTVAINWSGVQPYEDDAGVPPGYRSVFQDVDGTPTDFSASDAIYARAAARGLRVLPVLAQAPAWARLHPDRLWSPPSSPAAYGRYVRAVVQRYGTGGTFWRAHPELPALPSLDWQIWNEPVGFAGPGSPSSFWADSAPYQPRYLAMLGAARRAIRATDPQGRVLLGGIFGRSWLTLEDLYKRGAGKLFDAVAVHVYTKQPADVLRSLQLDRRVMDRHGDARKDLLLTEFGWPSAARRVDPADEFGYEVTEAGQAARLKTAARLLAGHRRALRLTQAYWYTWLSDDAAPTYSFDYSGLRHLLPSGAVLAKPAEAAFRTVARQLEGCAKTVDARRCAA